ncbi:MAG: tetratricopeptide repeat protein [Pseudomonadota bacterium]|nr:hypothetical protein [Pseudomonadales bacterium]MDY6921551.1 tetratricopeptide repeat protein [Pseudomonadota bacterium]
MIYKRILCLIPVLSLLTLNACSLLSGDSGKPAPVPAEETAAAEETPPTRAFERDTLFELLLAEFAGKRNRADVALGKYLKQAHETRDPQVVERAAFIARYLGAHQATLDAAMLWTEIEPDNPVPRELAAIELIRFDQLDAAMAQVDRLLASDGRMNFEYLLQAARGADQETRQKILARLRQYSTELEDARLWYAKGALEAMNGNHPQAMTDFNRALELEPSYGSAILARAQSLIASNRTDEAMKYLAQQTSLWPEDKRLGVAYARYLMQQGQLDAAQQQFYRLSRNFPLDGDLVLSLALLSWENQKTEQAKAQFHRLLEMNHRTDEANIYLARIAASEENYDLASQYFRQVTLGPQYPLAQIQLALLQQKQGRLETALATLDQARDSYPKEAAKFTLAKSEVLADADRVAEAIAVLDQALAATPDNINMLYTRAMLKEQLDDFDGMESDLRQVLELQPDNSAALNALGYTFANRNQRLKEAWELIERAYELNPEDPAIIDSMGWIKYRLGQKEAALDYLRQAYEAFEDQEIAAHLGEVLWVTGQREEALIIWREALEKNPDSEILRDVMRRFAPGAP